MRSVEVEGNSRVDATRRALELLGADIDDVKVEVVKEERRGVLGFLGFRHVTVRVTLVEENVLEQAAEIINKIVSFLPVPVQAAVGMQKDKLQLTLSSHELRAFQKQEDIADALGHVLELILNRKAHRKVLVKSSFAGEAVSREDELAALARTVADRVTAAAKEEMLPPMTPRDRRTVHMTLERDDRVTTESRGEGARRRVVVYPISAKPPARSAAEKRPAAERARPPSRRRRKPPPKPVPAGGERDAKASSRRPHRRTRPKGGGKKSPPPKAA